MLTVSNSEGRKKPAGVSAEVRRERSRKEKQVILPVFEWKQPLP
jgi:hypothetical protein